MPKPVVLIAEELSPATVDALGPDFEIRNVDGTDRPALLAALADAHAVLVRSATKVDAEAIAAAPNLKVVARAGVGLDNVDIKAATTAGVMVVNAPTSNIISAAELTVGHILSLARHIPAAHASLAAGAWKRSAVHRRRALREDRRHHRPRPHRRAHHRSACRPSASTVIAYDPYVTTARAQQLGVELVSLDDLLAPRRLRHDPHAEDARDPRHDLRRPVRAHEADRVRRERRPRRPDRRGRPAPCAHRRTRSPAPASTSSSPSRPKDSPLLALPNVVVTPHLGASTDEAQEKAGVSVAKSVRLALGGELVPDAVNVAGGVIDPYVRPGIPLVEKLGQVFTGARRPRRSRASTSRCTASSPSTTSAC